MSPEVFLSWLGVGAYVGAILLALAIGRRAERIGACICLLGGALTAIAPAVAGEELPYFAFLAIDLSMALGFGALALKYPDKLWPGVAGVSQTMLIVFSATRALDFPLSGGAYAAAMNLSSIAVAFSLGAGAVLARRPVADAAEGAPVPA